MFVAPFQMNHLNGLCVVGWMAGMRSVLLHFALLPFLVIIFGVRCCSDSANALNTVLWFVVATGVGVGAGAVAAVATCYFLHHLTWKNFLSKPISSLIFSAPQIHPLWFGFTKLQPSQAAAPPPSSLCSKLLAKYSSQVMQCYCCYWMCMCVCMGAWWIFALHRNIFRSKSFTRC